MAENWALNVKKYAPDADDAVIAKIVRYCGIALTKPDSSLVSFTDAKETARVRNNFCKKKLGLTDSDADIDAMIARVGERMSDDRTRNRVTVYYLLADAFGKLSVFGGTGTASAVAGAAAASAAVAGAAAASAAAATPILAAAPAPATTDQPPAATPLAFAGTPPADGGATGGFALKVLGVLGLAILVAAIGGSLIGGLLDRTPKAPDIPPATIAAVPAATAPTAAPAPAAIPQGSGVIAQQVAGKPMVSVYFDTGKTGIAADFATVAAPVKAWVDANPGARLAVSGFNDPSGNAALNAELSKNRAQAVAAALAGIGVPADRIDLVKPPETTDTTIDAAQARRVDIVVAN